MLGECYSRITKKSILDEVHKGVDCDIKDKYETEYHLNHNEHQDRRYCNFYYNS